MSQNPEEQKKDSGPMYTVDPRYLGELMRLSIQHRLITDRVLKGIFGDLPKELDHIRHGNILSFGSSSGDWALDCASANPKAQVLGIDNRPQMLAYAEAKAEEKGLTNLFFRRMDISQALDFEPSTFDFINLVFTEHILSEEEFQRQLQEFERILKPGGGLAYLRIEEGITDASIQNTTYNLYLAALGRQGKHLPPPDKNLSSLVSIRKQFRQSRLKILKIDTRLLDYSAEAEFHEDWIRNQRIGMELLKASRVNEQETWEQIAGYMDRLVAQQDADDFIAFALLLHVFAMKPAR